MVCKFLIGDQNFLTELYVLGDNTGICASCNSHFVLDKIQEEMFSYGCKYKGWEKWFYIHYIPLSKKDDERIYNNTKDCLVNNCVEKNILRVYSKPVYSNLARGMEYKNRS
jgi:hypothetical protein